MGEACCGIPCVVVYGSCYGQPLGPLILIGADKAKVLFYPLILLFR
jgi:hypothetical protein